MGTLNRAFILFSFVLFLLLIQVANSAEQVSVKFFYYDPSVDPRYCNQCAPEVLDDFRAKNATLTEIMKNYTGRVLFVWKAFYSDINHYVVDQNVSNEMREYNATLMSDPAPNSIVIIDGKGNFTTFVGFGINETLMEQTIDAYLAGSEPPTPLFSMPLITILASAFTFGIFETVSPCLLVLLSFVLSYSLGETTHFKEGFAKVMTFGIGFIFATAIVFLGSAGLVVASSVFDFQGALSYAVLAVAIFFGLDLLGFNLLKLLKIEVETKSVVQRLSRRLVYSYTGLIILGFLFYFLDPCLAPIFVVMLNTFQQMLLGFLPIILLVFCLGVMIPFVGIGVLAGSISKLTRSTYRYRSEMRAISGLILIIYAIYFIGFFLAGLGLATTLIIDTTLVIPIIVFVVIRSFRSRYSRSSHIIQS